MISLRQIFQQLLTQNDVCFDMETRNDIYSRGNWKLTNRDWKNETKMIVKMRRFYNQGVIARCILHAEKLFPNLFKLDCTYHFSINLELNGHCPLDSVRLNGKYNLISVSFNKIAKVFLCV